MVTLWTWITITDIPVKVFASNILPFCEVKDVVSLGRTNRFFALVATDETFWKRKLAVDYNFPVSGTARTSRWKFIYQRLRNPRVFVWGCVTLFSYVTVLICLLMRSCMLAGTIQREGQRPTWVTTISKDEPRGCSFSGRTSPSRCPCGQPGSECRVSANPIPNLNKHLHILLSPHIDRAIHALGSDGSVYVWGGCF